MFSPISNVSAKMRQKRIEPELDKKLPGTMPETENCNIFNVSASFYTKQVLEIVFQAIGCSVFMGAGAFSVTVKLRIEITVQPKTFFL
jgi:hypothetical protein